MITYILGDVTQTKSLLIAHGVNTQGVMASGVAKAIRTKFPYAYEEYMKAYRANKCSERHLRLGEVIYAKAPNYPTIANCVTQEFYGRDNKLYVDYDAIMLCMTNLNRYCCFNNIDQLAMPMIGAGLGGGNWEEIALIINENIVATTLVYQLR